jgi:hypothetical protein
MTAPLLRTPVAFLVFNRPQCTAAVFAEIRRARPPKLLVVADGPRADRVGEAQLCAGVRALIEEGVDWPCEVFRNYSEINLGCRRRVSSGLDWVFEQVEEAIILEDDCLPHPSFFRFCEELLEYYRNDTRIMMISGHNEHSIAQNGATEQRSYFFSTNIHIWAWATWRRAWRFYDVEMGAWPAARDGKWLRDMLTPEQNPAFWQDALEDVYRGRNDTWDWQWAFACWMQRGLSILPNRNLITNIGFSDTATHTTKINPIHTERPAFEMSFPLHHQSWMIGDAVLNYRAVELPSRSRYFLRKLKSWLFRRRAWR